LGSSKSARSMSGNTPSRCDDLGARP
jgi:hypothetical protein